MIEDPGWVIRAVSSCLMGAVACGGVDPATTPVTEGDAPQIHDWSGSQNCCGEDPHPVHGAALRDGSVVMVGKSAFEGGTAGFVTRWRPPVDATVPDFVDEDGDVIRATTTLGYDSALLQVVGDDDAVIAVGYRAESPTAAARALVLVLDPVDLSIQSELELSAAGESAAFEAIDVDDEGKVVIGGSRGFPRAAMEGFKSYGNIVGGIGLAVTLDRASLLGVDAATTSVLDVPGAREVSIPELHSTKSVRWLPDGGLAAIGHDDEEVSRLVVVSADLDSTASTTYDDDVELTDLVVVPGSDGSEYTLALAGHGGPDTIDGNVKLVDASGAIVWAASFGNPGVDAAEVPEAGLAPDAFIYDECWGIAVRESGEIVVACGTGIEGCGAGEFPSATAGERDRCRSDPRRSWRSYVVALSPAGEVAWSRADSFVDEFGEAAESAAEYLAVDAADRVAVIIDQNFGVGLAHLAD